MELLFWVIVITWMVNRTVVDGLYALQGKPSPRHELAKAKLTAAGQPTPAPARYGTRQWWDDLYSDALQANTRWRRNRRTQGGTVINSRVDDMVDVIREPATPPTTPAEPFVPQWLADKAGDPQQISSVVHTDQHPYCLTPCGPTCPASRPRHGWRCDQCGTNRHGFTTLADATAHPRQPTNPGIAPVIPLFPTTTEVLMSTGSDVTGLSAAMAFATAAAEAHESFATAGSEGYTNALQQFQVGDECVGLARQAQEASALAAAAWAAHREALERQMTVKEAYQGVPDAGNKEFLLNS